MPSSGIFRPRRNVTIRGILHSKSVFIPKGVTVTVRKSLRWTVATTITVLGTLKAERMDSADGISLELIAGNDIEIRGKILAGQGVPGKVAAEGEIAVASQGSSGGSISLESRTGAIRVGRTAKIVAGDGGKGASATGTGLPGKCHGAPGGIAVAIGGRGGDGGSILLTSRKGVTLEFGPGILSLGNGGGGGSATALGGRGADAGLKGSPGLGGKVYSRGGDGGASGRLPTEMLSTLTVLGPGGAPIPLDIPLLRKLVLGGRGGDAGDSIGTGGLPGE